jgi:hypothetical protein
MQTGPKAHGGIRRWGFEFSAKFPVHLENDRLNATGSKHFFPPCHTFCATTCHSHNFNANMKLCTKSFGPLHPRFSSKRRQI